MKIDMISSKCYCVTTYVWMLMSFFPAVITGQTFNVTSVVHRGKSVNISCSYKSLNGKERVSVTLETNVKLCSVMNNNNSRINQSCNEHYRFVRIPEFKEMLFEVLNLQINDTGIYKCVEERLIPPPSLPLGEERTFVQVIACPNVSVSLEKSLDGFSTILCSIEGFYPSAIEQLWLRNGVVLDVSHTHNIYNTTSDGLYTIRSYLNISDCANYSCWVNHSSLCQPKTLHLTLGCHKYRGVFIFVLIPVLLVIAVVNKILSTARKGQCVV